MTFTIGNGRAVATRLVGVPAATATRAGVPARGLLARDPSPREDPAERPAAAVAVPAIVLISIAVAASVLALERSLVG